MIYISDLSWTKKIKHPREFCKANENIEIVVLELDVDNRKLSLGHKQLKENPWNKYEKEFKLNSIHKSEVYELVPKGAIVKLNEDVTGFVPSRHLIKEQGGSLDVNEEASFKIIEFNKDSKRIVLSHSQTYKKKEEESSKSKKKKTKTKEKEESKTTIGDVNEQLKELKDKMDAK